MASKRKQEDFPRGAVQEVKRPKPINEEEEKDDDTILSKHKKMFIEQVSVKNLNVDTLVVGCVQEIYDYEVKLVLPGSISCVIPIVNISSYYTQALQEFAADPLSQKRPLKLQSMFHMGQQLLVKVLEKRNEEIAVAESLVPYVQVIGTCNPVEIYENINSAIFTKCCKHFVIQAAVKSVEDHGYIMDLGVQRLTGFLRKEHARELLKQLNISTLTVGQVLCCLITGSYNGIIQLTCDPNEMFSTSLTNEIRGHFPSTCILPGLNVKVRVVDIQDAGLEVLVFDEFPGYILKDHLASIWHLPAKDYAIDQELNATILCQNPNTKHVILTLRNNFDPKALPTKWHLRVGEKFPKCTVINIDKKGTLTLKMASVIKGIAPINELIDEYLEKNDVTFVINNYPINSKHEVRIKSYSFIDGYAKVTLKPSLINIEETALDQLKIGSFVTGTVKQLNSKGLVLKIGYAARAFVPLMHLTESMMIKNLEKLFPLGKKVSGRVYRMDLDTQPPKICLTLKKSLLSNSLFVLDTPEKAQSGLQTDGVICLIKDDGLLLEFFNRLRAWVSKVHVLNRDLSSYRIGQVVKCTIIRVNADKQKIYATLLNKANQPNESSKKSKDLKDFDWNEAEAEANKKAQSNNKESSIESEETVDEEEVSTPEISREILKMEDQGFDWNYDPMAGLSALNLLRNENQTNEESESDTEKTEKSRGKSGREKEEYLRSKENELMEKYREPEDKNDFERMVIASPNSSLSWIKYMSWLAERNQIDDARQVGERALNAISYREEKEKLNVWAALLNLENAFGNEESLLIVYRRAQKMNDEFSIFKVLVQVFAKDEKFDKAVEVFGLHVKKLKHLKAFWIDYGVLLYKLNKVQQARKVLEQSLKSLERIEHLDIISKFAQLEFKSGETERGKSLFENLLSTYPKRLDIWMVYLDVMIKYGRTGEDNMACIQSIRNIFERMLNLKLKPKSLVTVLKKYENFEQKFGNKTTLERVKEKLKDAEVL